MMYGFTRAAVSVASLFCVVGVATVSAPSFASETTGAQVGSATAMLAAVTAPMLAVNVQTLEASKPDFSTQGDATGSALPSPDAAADAAEVSPASLSDLVADNSSADAASEDDTCLATTVYYESKGEPLNGQLAVAQTILNRAASGRFADSVCGVVRQPGQFSFLHAGTMPSPPRASSAWQRAVAIAKIAREGLWKQIAPAALYFHARRVSPGWSKTRVASIGNHVFFR